MSPDYHLYLLEQSLSSRRARSTRHRLWSNFIHARDGSKCLICESTKGTAAHHVVRRCLLAEAQFLTGNGATLCRDCHKESHRGFNGAPDFSLPIDAQGGEKLEAIAELYRVLAKKFLADYPDREDFFFLTEDVLTKCKVMQGFGVDHQIAGSPIEQAWFIWDCAPVNVVEALVRANLRP